MDTIRLEKITTFFEDLYLNRGLLSSMSTLVALKGHIVHEAYQGTTEFTGNSSIGPESIFRIYSMTKPITSLAAVMLMEEAKLHLDDPVAKYISEFDAIEVWDGGDDSTFTTRKPDRAMTVKDLFLHTSGLTYGHLEQHPVDALYRRDMIGRPDESLASVSKRLPTLPLIFSPGERWNYGVSTDVLGHIIEIISEQSLDDFLRTRILDPLQMNDTHFYLPEDKIDRLVACYTLNPETGEPVPFDGAGRDSTMFYHHQALLSGGGGLVSTARDFWRFCECLRNGGTLDGVRLISPKSWDFMIQNHLPGGQTIKQMGDQTFSETRMEGNGFGLGASVVSDVADTMTPGSVGTFSWGGMANTYFFVDPVEDIVAIQLTQMVPSTLYPIRPQFTALVYAALTR